MLSMISRIYQPLIDMPGVLLWLIQSGEESSHPLSFRFWHTQQLPELWYNDDNDAVEILLDWGEMEKKSMYIHTYTRKKDELSICLLGLGIWFLCFSIPTYLLITHIHPTCIRISIYLWLYPIILFYSFLFSLQSLSPSFSFHMNLIIYFLDADMVSSFHLSISMLLPYPILL